MITVQWLPKSRDSLPSTKPHSSSQNNIRRVASSWVWAVGLLPESFWDRNGHGLWIFLSHFSISHASWLLPVVFELLCRSLLREQYQNSWFPVGWRAEMSWRCLSNLKMVVQLLLSRWRRWYAVVLLFFNKIRHNVGSTSSRYAAHSLSASVSDFMGPTDRLSSVIQMLGWLVFGLQLFSFINPIIFRPNNYIISIFLGYGLYVSFLWACEQCRDSLIIGPDGLLGVV